MWRELTEDDLVATLSRKEVDAYRNDFEIDPVPTLLAETTAWARGYIRTNGNVRMDPNERTLPESVISPAMDYVAIKILKRLNIEPKEIRKQARTDAISYFEQIASGKVNPEGFGELPQDDSEMSVTAPAFSDPRPARLLD